MAITYQSISLPNHTIYNTPYFQRFFSIDIPDISQEIESRLTQHITQNDILRVPSSHAVFEYVTTTVGTTIGLTVIPTIQPHVYDKSPSSDSIFNEFLTVPKLHTENVFNNRNTFQKIHTSSVFDMSDTAITTQIPSAAIIRDFIYEVLDSNTEKYIFNSPGLEWEVNHGRGTDSFIECVRDDTNKTVYAEVELEDLDTVKFKFTTPTRGYVILKF